MPQAAMAALVGSKFRITPPFNNASLVQCLFFAIERQFIGALQSPNLFHPLNILPRLVLSKN